MDLNSFNAYLAEDHNTAPTISVDDLDGPDRTLVFGYDVERNSFHVYVKDGQIHKLLYKGWDAAARVLSYETGAVFPAAELVPNKRAYPERTDRQFASTMASLDARLCFTRFDEDSYDRHAGLAFTAKLREDFLA